MARRRDEERLSIRPAERTAGRLAHGKLDDLIDPTVRRIADDAPRAPTRGPEEASRIHRRTVRHAGTALDENLLVQEHRTLGPVAESPDQVAPAVGEIETLAVRAPGKGVGDADVRQHPPGLPIRIDNEQPAAGAGHRARRGVGRDVVLHGSQPQAPLGIAAALV
jgi:hypothetical protein